MDILRAISDAKLFGPWFRDAATWRAWTVFLRALFGLPMSAEDLSLFTQITGRTDYEPGEPAQEAWLAVGRRGGKSFVVGLVAVYLACFRDYSQYLAPGERGTVMILAADRKQARVIFRYVRALLDEVRMLRRMVRSVTAERIALANRIDLEIHTASFRSVRGYTIVAALLDEVAFWRSDDSANPDREILEALRPGMATIPNALLLALSSPYARRGVLWEATRDHYGHNGDPVLVVQAATEVMNPTVPRARIERAYAEDPASAAAEYGAQFRSDVEMFLREEWLEAAVAEGVHERPPRPDTSYFAFCDPSGGASDSFTLAIAHVEEEDRSRVVLDVCRGRRPPFSPEDVVRDYATLCKRYNCFRVSGDRYAGEWVSSAFSAQGLAYDTSSLPKSAIYLEAEPLFAQGAVQLLDLRPLLVELRQLERRPAGRLGRDSVDHPPRAHDDHANAACGAVWLAAKQRGPSIDFEEGVRTIAPDAEQIAERTREFEWEAVHGRKPWWD